MTESDTLTPTRYQLGEYVTVTHEHTPRGDDFWRVTTTLPKLSDYHNGVRVDATRVVRSWLAAETFARSAAEKANDVWELHRQLEERLAAISENLGA